MSVQEKQRAAQAQQEARAKQQDFMSLAPGVGIIPVEYRNLGYRKLEFGPGEGGIRAARPEATVAASDDRMTAFLAGVAAGADPEKLAGQLLAGQADTKPTRRRKAAAGATQPENEEVMH